MGQMYKASMIYYLALPTDYCSLPSLIKEMEEKNGHDNKEYQAKANDKPIIELLKFSIPDQNLANAVVATYKQELLQNTWGQSLFAVVSPREGAEFISGKVKGYDIKRAKLDFSSQGLDFCVAGDIYLLQTHNSHPFDAYAVIRNPAIKHSNQLMDIPFVEQSLLLVPTNNMPSWSLL
jgi:hypothetical protein